MVRRYSWQVRDKSGASRLAVAGAITLRVEIGTAGEPVGCRGGRESA